MMFLSCASRGRNPDNLSERNRSRGIYRQRIEINNSGNSNTITTVQKDYLLMELPQIMRSERTNFGKSVRKQYERHEINLKRQDMRIWRPRKNGVSNCITTLTKDNIMIEQKRNEGKLITEEVAVKLKLPKEYVGKRFRIRKLTPRECFRLMDVGEENIDKLLNAKNEKGQQLISNSQCYKLAGNSIVVSCMEYMFRNLLIGIPEDEKGKQEPVQLKLF